MRTVLVLHDPALGGDEVPDRGNMLVGKGEKVGFAPFRCSFGENPARRFQTDWKVWRREKGEKQVVVKY